LADAHPTPSVVADS